MKYLASLLILIVLTFDSNAQELNTEAICVFPEVPYPKFLGGMDSLNSFFNKSSKWNQGKLTVEGKVFVQFHVNEDGSISNTEVVKGLCDTCDKEAVRLVEMMPNWIPAVDNGKVVRSKMILPIAFER